MNETRRILAVIACPSRPAEAARAAENLETSAHRVGHEIKVETHGPAGVENAFTAEDVERADAVVVAADQQVDLARFAGKRITAAPVADGVHRPDELLHGALAAVPGAKTPRQQLDDGEGRGTGATVHEALMNGASHMIPFVVAGGLLLALALSLGGTPAADALAIPEDTYWHVVSRIGDLAFTLMIPVLSGYIAYAIAGRPALAPGMIGGFLADTEALHGSEAGAGFLGAIGTGLLAGYVARGIERLPVPRWLAPLWPTIVVPVVTTLLLALLLGYLLGSPSATAIAGLNSFLAGLEDGSAIVLGAVLGAMVGFDMGGPVNKTAFAFGGGLAVAGNGVPMGMVAAAVAVPPLGMGIATLLRRRYFTTQEREAGIGALAMGFFGITEGAIPFAAAHPLQVVPANVLGGAVAGTVAALLGVEDHVLHGGPIAAILGAVENVVAFLVAIVVGTLVTALLALFLMALNHRTRRDAEAADATWRRPAGAEPSRADDSPGSPSAAGATSAGSTSIAARRRRKGP